MRYLDVVKLTAGSNVAPTTFRRSLMFLGLLLAVNCTPVGAATNGLENQLYLVAVGGPNVLLDRQDSSSPSITDTYNLGPTKYYTASSTTNATITSGYGFLDAVANGVAKGDSGNGALSWVLPYVGGAPLASYYDTITVGSSTLAAGTPVTLSFDLTFTGATSSQADPGNTASAQISSSTIVRDLQHDSLRLVDVSYSAPGSFADTKTINTYIGDTLSVQGQLFASGSAQSNGFGSASFSFSDPTTLFIRNGDGVTLQTASGHDYAPVLGGVPEPATWAMMLLGFGAIGLAMRRRNAPLQQTYRPELGYAVT